MSNHHKSKALGIKGAIVGHRGYASYLDGKGPLREVLVALLGLLELPRGIGLGETTTDSPSLLRSKIQRQVLLVLVEETELGTLLGVDDGQDASD